MNIAKNAQSHTNVLLLDDSTGLAYINGIEGAGINPVLGTCLELLAEILQSSSAIVQLQVIRGSFLIDSNFESLKLFETLSAAKDLQKIPTTRTAYQSHSIDQLAQQVASPPVDSSGTSLHFTSLTSLHFTHFTYLHHSL